MNENQKNVVFIGNPNSGKTTLFNLITGLHHKTGNFPGVTVDKKHSVITLNGIGKVNIVDLPGCYSLYPTAYDEKVVFKILSDSTNELFPDLIVYVADATQLERHLLLYTQLKDLDLPIILCLNMQDLVVERKIEINDRGLEKIFESPVLWINGRNGDGLSNLKQKITELLRNKEDFTNNFQSYVPDAQSFELTKSFKKIAHSKNQFQSLLVAHHYTELDFLKKSQKDEIATLIDQNKFNSLKLQIDETMQRYRRIDYILSKHVSHISHSSNNITFHLDRIFTNRIWGPIIFFSILIILFQAVFSWAEWPMELIENGISGVTKILKANLSENWLTSLITEGILPGLGGVLVFIPQIAILFLFTSFLEELGYMARAVYLFDRLMLRFGLNGRSIVALVSGAACAIPAIMSARTINNWKERLITIMVTPLISCSARLPVFAVLITFVITENKFYGPFNLRGLILLMLYSLGIIAALIAAGVFKKILKTNELSFLMIELPEYKVPHWKNILLTVKDKVQSFISQAGGIILIISVILWVLSTFGPGDEMEKAKVVADKFAQSQKFTLEEANNHIAAAQLESSYAGHIGKFIEPAIKPLGFDWKIGIALITSFAAREVFIGTMSTIYSIGSGDESSKNLQEKMAREINHNTGLKTFSFAASMSLLFFYLFAMQCVSTMAVVKKETGTWKWPIIQFLYMGVLAYLSSWIVYVILS